MTEKPKRTKKPKLDPTRCLYVMPGENGAQCPSPPYALGYCREHVNRAPQEIENLRELRDNLDAAKHKMLDCADQLLHFVVWGDGKLPEDMQREYRNLWHRHNYLTNVFRDRRPGDDLPAEVFLR